MCSAVLFDDATQLCVKHYNQCKLDMWRQLLTVYTPIKFHQFFGLTETFLSNFAELIQNKSKDGIKLKKKQKTKEQMEPEDQDCEPPAAKKKKKNDKVTVDQENDNTDMNGNGSIETSPKKTKKNNGENTEVCVFFLLHF